MAFSQYFKKRSFTFKSFLRDFVRIMKKNSDIRDTMKSERVSKQFRERIMLAVTAVNGCRYCEWGHTKAALNEGCSEEEVEQIMTHDFGSCNPDEVVALAYAQHYAETEENPSPDAWKRVVNFYGEEKAKDIQILIEMITMGNLLGNTLDAFESRLKGIPPENGSLFFELFLYSLALPFVLIFNNRYEKWKKLNNPHPDLQH
ncbi:carboxymuconolactone decarboxylase family protein [Candidatus Heimdallarchaeota archaeon]|nr:MAG: carboxymuconolactone decarboxylase family protein [Candidatus Heimdallarchaeota archaeon]